MMRNQFGMSFFVRTKRQRGSKASHFFIALLCVSTCFSLLPMLISSSSTYNKKGNREEGGKWERNKKKKGANLRESRERLTWGSSWPLDTFVVVTFIRAFWPEGVRFSYLFSFSPPSSSYSFFLHFHPSSAGLCCALERMTLFHFPHRPYLFESLMGLLAALWCYTGLGVRNLRGFGRGKSRFPPPPTAQTTPGIFFFFFFFFFGLDIRKEERESPW